MKTTLEVINRMQADRVIDGYAIGGAVGATFYLEPVATLDIAIFVSFRQLVWGHLVSLSPIYEYLSARGFKVEKEYIVIGGWPVQLLPTADALGEEALAQAIETDIEGVRTRVMTAEHLVALALQTGRAKDTARMIQFVESGVLDPVKLDALLSRHGLTGKWDRFVDKFGGDT